MEKNLALGTSQKIWNHGESNIWNTYYTFLSVRGLGLTFSVSELSVKSDHFNRQLFSCCLSFSIVTLRFCFHIRFGWRFRFGSEVQNENEKHNARIIPRIRPEICWDRSRTVTCAKGPPRTTKPTKTNQNQKKNTKTTKFALTKNKKNTVWPKSIFVSAKAFLVGAKPFL